MLFDEKFRTCLIEAQDAEIAGQVEALPLRLDVLTLLKYVRDQKVVGTSAGNMPLKAVREVTARFVNPPELETTIGEETFRIRSETELWHLYILRIIAQIGNLITAEPSRRWRLTAQGVEFFNTDPFLQVVYVLAVWWYKINWLVAYPFQGMDDSLPQMFNLTTLDHLLSLPVGQQISFDEFADELIEHAGLTWTAADMSSAQTSLRGSIAQMVIHVMADYDIVELEYIEKRLGQGTMEKLEAFEITPLGRILLEAMALSIQLDDSKHI